MSQKEFSCLFKDKTWSGFLIAATVLHFPGLYKCVEGLRLYVLFTLRISRFCWGGGGGVIHKELHMSFRLGK